MNSDEQDPKAAFGVPMRASQRKWIKVEAARREIRIQDLIEELVAAEQARVAQVVGQVAETAREQLRQGLQQIGEAATNALRRSS